MLIVQRQCGNPDSASCDLSVFVPSGYGFSTKWGFSDVLEGAYRNTGRKANVKEKFLGDGRVFASAFPLVQRLRVCSSAELCVGFIN